MIAIMLCAGYGTRLHPMTRHLPKGLLEVGGNPILDYQMPQLLELPELESIHLVTNGHYTSHFYRWLEGWRPEIGRRGISMHIHNDGSLEEENRLGAVGDLAFVCRHTGLQRAVITAGDTIYRFPLSPIAQEFLNENVNLILALREPSYQVRQRYAVIEFGDGDRVARLHDRPESPPTEWVCPTLYFLQPEVLGRLNAYLEQGGDSDSMPAFLDFVMTDEPIRAVRKPDARVWLDVETRYMFNKANEILEHEPVMIEA